MKELFNHIANREDLSEEEVEHLFDEILNNDISESEIAAFLMGLKVKEKHLLRLQGLYVRLKIMRCFCQENLMTLCVIVALVATNLTVLIFQRQQVLF